MILHLNANIFYFELTANRKRWRGSPGINSIVIHHRSSQSRAK